MRDIGRGISGKSNHAVASRSAAYLADQSWWVGYERTWKLVRQFDFEIRLCVIKAGDVTRNETQNSTLLNRFDRRWVSEMILFFTGATQLGNETTLQQGV